MRQRDPLFCRQETGSRLLDIAEMTEKIKTICDKHEQQTAGRRVYVQSVQ